MKGEEDFGAEWMGAPEGSLLMAGLKQQNDV